MKEQIWWRCLRCQHYTQTPLRQLDMFDPDRDQRCCPNCYYIDSLRRVIFDGLESKIQQ